MRIRATSIVACCLLAACGPYPQDVERTLDKVVERGELRVAVAAMPPDEQALAERYARRVADAAGVELRIDPGENSTEALIGRLDDGELDLLVAGVATDSPWLAEVAVIEPLALRRSGSRTIGLSPMASNGENRWIGLLEKEARAMGAPQ